MKKDITKDESFFEIIDSEEKAYFLGFLVADGSISKETNRISFTINTLDKYILEKFKDITKSSNLVRDYKVFDKRNNVYNLSTSFQINSKKIKQDLENLGISAYKSVSFNYEKIVLNKYFNHFLRGLFDGDGHIAKNRTMLMIISTKEFLIYLNKNLLDKEYKISKITDDVHRIYIQNKAMCIKFLDYIYKDATIFLKRKYDLYRLLKNIKIYNTSQVKKCTLIPENGENPIKFNSIKEAAKFLNVHDSTLIKMFKKYTIYKGYKIEKEKAITERKEI